MSVNANIIICNFDLITYFVSNFTYYNYTDF